MWAISEKGGFFVDIEGVLRVVKNVVESGWSVVEKERLFVIESYT